MSSGSSSWPVMSYWHRSSHESIPSKAFAGTSRLSIAAVFIAIRHQEVQDVSDCV